MPALKGLKRSAAAICYYRRSRLPFARPQRLNTHPRQLRPGTQATVTAICYYRRSRLPFAHPQRPKTLRGSFDQGCRPQPSATISVRGCRLPALKGLKRFAAASTGSFDQALTQATVICYYPRSRLSFARPQRLKTFRGSFDWLLRPGTQATAICYYRRSRPLSKSLNRSAAASTRHAGHSHLLLSAFEAAVCLPSKV